MADPLIPVTPVNPIDLTDERVETGDQQEFVDKMSVRDDKYAAFSAEVHQAMEDLSENVTRTEARLTGQEETINTAVAAQNTTISDAISAQDTVISNQNNALNTAISNQNTAISNAATARENDQASFENSVNQSVTNIGNTATAANSSASAAVSTANAASAAAAAAAQETEVDTKILKMRNSALNLLPHNGCFINSENGFAGWGQNDFPFAPEIMSLIFNSYNGSDLETGELRRFYSDSVTYGGNGLAIDSLVNRWLIAMGMTDTTILRNLRAWAIAQTTSGNGNLGSVYKGCYRCFSTSEIALRYGMNSSVSGSFWIEPVADDAYVRGYSDADDRTVWLNGTEIKSNDGDEGTAHHLLEAYEVQHIAFTLDAESGPISISNFVTEIFTKPGARLRWANLRMASGSFQLLPHSWAVKSIPGANT